MPRPDGRDLHLEEGARLLQNLDYSLAETKAAPVELDSSGKFHFASPRPTVHAVNNVVHGHLYPCGGDWRQKPVILLIHGWNDVLHHRYLFPRHARRFNRLGLSAVTLQLPWHFDRRPRELGAWSNFLCADVLRTAEATIQAVAEIRTFTNWLIEQSCPFVGIWGVSLGGWLTGLAICHDARIGSALLMVPVARLDRVIKEAAFCETIRSVFNDRQCDLRKLDLIYYRPLIAKENILLIASEYDLFVPKDTIDELWQTWGKPEIWRYRHGHISVLGAPGLAERVARWFAARARASAAK